MRSHIPLTFPATRKALWSHTSLGEPIAIACPRLSLSVTEQALYLAYGLSRTAKSSRCWLGGVVNVEPDCSEVVVYIDQLKSDGSVEHDSSTSFYLSTKLTRNSRHMTKTQLDTETVEEAVMHLTDRAKEANKVILSEFLHATAECTVYAGTNQICCDLDVDVILPSSKFDAAPIDEVSVAATALSKSVLGSDKHGIISRQQKSGYLTMDQYRKVIFLLESDPKVLTVPIIGIWVSGVDLITDPYIWVCCIRYMHTIQIRDRVPKPSEPFLLIHKSPLMSSAQYFDCTPDSNCMNYKLLSGSHSFSMNKEVPGKRNGRLSVKTDWQDLSSPKGMQFATIIHQSLSKPDLENRCPSTLNSQRQGKKNIADDSLPWSSPVPNQFKGAAVTPLVPEVSLLDESSPLEAPKPQRQALQRLTDCRLNFSPTKKVDDHISTQYMRQDDSIARKITFGLPESIPYNSNEGKHPSSNLFSPSLRSSRPMNVQPQLSEQLLNRSQRVSSRRQQQRMPGKALHVSTQLAAPSNHHGHNPSIQPLLSTARCYCCQLHTPPAVNYVHRDCCQQMPCPPTNGGQCQMYQMNNTCHGTSNTTPTHPLKVITANVEKLLSPRQRDQAAKPLSPTDHCEGVDVSPIAVFQQSGVSQAPVTPTPLPTHRQSLPISPEVEEILRQQDTQLKALQQQIQQLLKAQKQQTPAAPVQKSTTTQTTCVAAVNTGASLFECKQFNTQGYTSFTDTHDSVHDSSTSHSLIQHDLTALDLPTQVTARSFTSDINVDYESYEGSLTGSPKKNDSHHSGFADSCQSSSDDSFHSRSEDSWQSPVLGESVSMMAESVNPESTKQQLDTIIKNVRDLLAKSTPGKDAADQALTAAGSTTPARSVTTEVNNDEGREENADFFTKGQLPINREIRRADHNVSEPGTLLPRVQYLSMVMTDTTLDSNKSLELNALALKYLHDDQLTELAHLTVHKGSAPNIARDSSLLRQVLMLPNRRFGYTCMEASDMSMATQQYLRRYELDTSISETDDDSAAMHFSNHTPSTNKSILRKVPETTEDTFDNDNGQEMSLKVLDIARLKELPKLL